MNGTQSELDAVGPLAEAFLSRYRRGERPSLTEYTQKYPELAEQIRDLFPALVVMEELGSVEGAGIGTAPTSGRGKVPEQLGDFRILREVRRGGMGIVYEAVQESLGRHVALKVLPVHSLMSPTHLERFRREARAAARLHHTNIVPVHGVGEHEGCHYFAMQFIQGQGLDEVLKEVKRLRDKKVPSSAAGSDTSESQSLALGLLSGLSGVAGASASASGSSNLPLAPASATAASGSELTAQPEAQYFRSVARMGMQAAGALDYAHKQGILHRDIKPSNLLLDTRGSVWVTDFGLAKAEDTEEELSHTGDIVGTLRYMAPERFNGWSDPRSDVYGLGITLYEMLTLRPAFDEANRARLIERITREDPPRPRKIDRSIPRDLETIVLKAISKEPARRYQTAEELADDLGRFLAGEPVHARRIGMWERGGKWVKRRPAVAALLAVSGAAALFVIGGTVVHNAQLEVALQNARDNLKKAERAEGQAQLAEQEKTRQLAIAYLKEAQARRNSGPAGRRFESLEALKKAARLFRELGQLDEERILELRNEVIACLALVDLKPGKAWTPDTAWSRPMGFHPTLQYYVVRSMVDEDPGRVDDRHGQLSVRGVADDKEVARLPGFGVRVVETQFSPDGRYLAAHYEWGQRHIYVWDLSRRKAILKVSWDGQKHFPSFSPDSRLVALARTDQSIPIYELPSGAIWKNLLPGLPVNSLHFHPDGRSLAVVSNKIVQLRDLSSGKEQARFKHVDDIATLAWRSDGNMFATGCYDNQIYLWDVRNTAQPWQTLKGHAGLVVHLTFSHGGDLLFSNSWDSTDRLWDTITGQQLVSKPGGLYHDHIFNPDDQKLDYDWQVATGRECRTFHGHQKPPSWASIGPNGRLMASVRDEGVQLWDLAAAREADKLLATLPVGTSCAVHFDPKGESLITDSKKVGLERWPIRPDPETGGLRIGPPQSLGLSARAPFFGDDPQACLSADGRTIAHSPHPGQVLLYDLESSARKLLIESPRLRAPAFSPDGRWLATGNWQGRGAKVWNSRTGELEHEFDVGDAEAGSAWLTFSPDGKWLVTGTFSDYVFWQTGSWRKHHTVSRVDAANTIGRLVFSPDSKLVALLHGVTEVRLVDPATGREFAHLPTAGCPYCFSPDGSQLVTWAGRGGAMQVWDLRLIRQQLKEMNLDWGLPPYPAPSETTKSLRVKVLAAEPLPPSPELDADAYLQRAQLYVQLRNYPKAGADFRRAGELAPKRPVWEEAVRVYSMAIEQHPDDADAYHQRAHAQERLSRWEKAIEDHCQAIQRAPQCMNLLICRGRAYNRLGEKDKAAEDFRKASEQKPDWANLLARELATAPDPQHRQPDLALELAKQAVRQVPGEALYWNTLGVAQYRLGEWVAAIRTLEAAEEMTPSKYFGFNAFFLAMCHHQLGDTSKAKDCYDRAVRWCQEKQGNLSATHQKELKNFRAEAEVLLSPPRAAR